MVFVFSKIVIYPSTGTNAIHFNGCIIFVASFKPLKKWGIHVFFLLDHLHYNEIYDGFNMCILKN